MATAKAWLMQEKNRKPDTRSSKLFILVVSVVGLCVFSRSLYVVALDDFNLQWLLLSMVTLLVVSRTDIHIPKIPSTVTLDDTFIYISVLLYGVQHSIALAGLNAIVCSLHYPNKRRVVPFNAAVMSLSVYASSTLVTQLFGSPGEMDLGRLILAAETLALVHYVLNSGMVSVVGALRNGRNVFQTWQESFLWTSVSYFAGAVAACLVVKLISIISFYAFIIAVPILAITYLTYKNYLDKVQVSITHAEAMADLHLRTIEALAVAIDAKDEVTHDHVHRVQIYTTGLARLFGLSDPEVEALQAGALLHDIGKLAVPDYILNKPDKLSAAEYEKMKVHTIVGAEILSRVGFPYPVVPVVRHHHERWDGRGYPDGLAGNQIPMTARILSVVDCFDAVREDRQYRKAMTREQAIELVKAGRGTMYDPEVVRVFLEHLPEFEAEIRRQKKEIQEARAHELSRPSVAGQRPDQGQVIFEHIRNAHREVITLYEIAQTIGTSLDLRDMFAVFSSRLQDIVSYTTCVLYLQKPNSIEVEAVHVSGRNADRFKGQSVILGAGITGWVVANRQPMYNCDPLLDLDVLKITVEQPYRTVVAVPLLKDNEVLGALTLYSADLSFYEPDHLRLVEAVAKLASDAIANALHHEMTEVKALTDPLTGIANARALRYRFEDEADRGRRYHDSFSLLMMDLDGFKRINDTQGHQAGDAAIKEVGRLLAAELRSGDFLSRYAGDEFVALLHIDPTEVRELVQRLQAAIDNHSFNFSGSQFLIGISVGWACFGADGESLDELLIAADRAMYADKARRKALIAAAEELQAAEVSQYPIM
ncbi:MAG TPA: diguanylate cyclase [Blastocatellia bacterium]|nr:diguanylate cyclase [Blastocatellia bacterium]